MPHGSNASSFAWLGTWECQPAQVHLTQLLKEPQEVSVGIGDHELLLPN
jgi:hypothetical protein